MTLTQDIDLPDSGFSPDCRDLLEGLLKRDVPDRLGCKGRGLVADLFNSFSYLSELSSVGPFETIGAKYEATDVNGCNLKRRWSDMFLR